MQTFDTMTGTVSFSDITVGGDSPATLSLSITDALGPQMAAIRAVEIMERTSDLGNFRAICIRDDISDPETFRETVAVVSTVWDGGIILESGNPASLLTASTMLDDTPLLSGCDGGSLIGIGSATGCPVSLRSDDISDLLDMVQSCSVQCVIDPATDNMKSCLERNTDLHRLSERIPEAGRPIMTRTWSGEYALAVASVSVMRYGSLIVIDDLDRDGCVILDNLADTFDGPRN
ncbi:MAG: hypothetical protein ACI38Y_01880 [Candidatus Methanomethylophilaceae archaeon]